MADDWHAPTQRAANFVVTSTVWNEETQDNLEALYSAMVGDAQATAEVIHKHKVGTVAARPTPGQAGRLYLPSDLDVMLVDDGAEWLIGSALSLKCVHFYDDFIIDYDKNWNEVLAGSGQVDQLDGHGGLMKLQTGSTDPSTVRVLNNTSGGDSLDPAEIHLAAYVLRSDHPTNNVQDHIVGWVDALPAADADPDNGIFLRKLGNANWFGVCRAAAAETTQDLGGTFAALTKVIVERSATGVSFYVDTWNAAGLQGAEVTTNIPAAELYIGFRANNTGTASNRAFTIDTTGLWAAR